MLGQLLGSDKAKTTIAKAQDSEVIETISMPCAAGKTLKKTSLSEGFSQQSTARLHFMRLGITLKKIPKQHTFFANHKAQQQQQIVHAKDHTEAASLSLNSAISGLDNFEPISTSLNPGYLYIINETDPKLWYEYQIDELGRFSPIYWDNNKDFQGRYKNKRKAEAAKEIDKIFQRDQVLWVAYSLVQWSASYHQSLREDPKKRAKRMQKIDLSHRAPSQQHNIFPHQEIQATFTAEQNTQAAAFQQTLDKVQQQAKSSDPKEPVNMFVVLDDPIHCALDIASALSDEINKHKAIIEALQTGGDPDDILQRLIDGGEAPKPTAEQQQIGALFTLALTQYQLVYNSEEMIDDYDGGDAGYFGGIYQQKLIDILGVNERKAQRAVVRSLRNDLGGFISSHYYQQPYRDMGEGTPENLLDGKFIAMQPFRLLAIEPHMLDRRLDLSAHRESDSQWDSLIAASLQSDSDTLESNPLLYALNKTLDFNEGFAKQGVDVSNKTAGFIAATLETYIKDTSNEVKVYAFNSKTVTKTVYDTYPLLVSRLNTLKVYGEDTFELRASEVKQELDIEGWRIDDSKVVAVPYKGKKDILRWSEMKSQGLYLKQSSHGKHLFSLPVAKDVEEIERTYSDTYTEKKPTKIGKKVQGILQSKAFTGVVALLQVVNLGAALHTASQTKGKSANQLIKDGINLIGISSELAGASYRLSHAIQKGQLTRVAADNIVRWAVRFEAAGAGITAIVCAWESVSSFDARDNDAALAWAGAAVSFGGLAATTLMTAAWAGPLGLVCAGIGLGLVILAYYLTDSPLETFFKNNALSDAATFPKLDNETPGHYITRFYQAKSRLNPDKDYQQWNNFIQAGAELSDLLVCSDISVKAAQLSRITEKSSNPMEVFLTGKSQHIIQGDIKTFTVSISFRQFLQRPEQLAFAVYFSKEGLKSSQAPQRIKGLQAKKTMVAGTATTPPKIEVTFEMPEALMAQYNKHSQILFVCALALPDKQFYPNHYDNKARLLGAYANTYHTHTDSATRIGRRTSSVIRKTNVAIDTLDNLISGKPWR